MAPGSMRSRSPTDVAGQLGQRLGIEARRLVDQPMLDACAMLGLDWRRKFVDGVDHDPGLIGRHRAGCLRGGNLGKQRIERGAGEGMSRSEINGRTYPLPGLVWGQSQHVT